MLAGWVIAVAQVLAARVIVAAEAKWVVVAARERRTVRRVGRAVWAEDQVVAVAPFKAPVAAAARRVAPAVAAARAGAAAVAHAVAVAGHAVVAVAAVAAGKGPVLVTGAQ